MGFSKKLSKMRELVLLIVKVCFSKVFCQLLVAYSFSKFELLEGVSSVEALPTEES